MNSGPIMCWYVYFYLILNSVWLSNLVFIELTTKYIIDIWERRYRQLRLGRSPIDVPANHICNKQQAQYAQSVPIRTAVVSVGIKHRRYCMCLLAFEHSKWLRAHDRSTKLHELRLPASINLTNYVEWSPAHRIDAIGSRRRVQRISSRGEITFCARRLLIRTGWLAWSRFRTCPSVVVELPLIPIP